MTQERVDGIPIGDRDAIIAAGHDPDEVMKKCAEAFFYQVFRDGFFHADMHGGNAFVDRRGPHRAGRFRHHGPRRRGHARLSRRAAGRLPAPRLSRASPRSSSARATCRPISRVETFAQACRSIGEPIFGKPSHQISIARLLAQMLRVTEQFEMSAQPQLLLLQKTMLMAEGMGTQAQSRTSISGSWRGR